MTDTRIAAAASLALKLRRVATFPGVRVLAWAGDVLYGCRGYQVVSMRAGDTAEWKAAGNFRPAWWRNLTSRNALTYRLTRDGFHALAVIGEPAAGASFVGAVPGAIVSRDPNRDEFRVTHKIQRGTRPLHFAAVPSGNIYWGEYFDNRERAEVHIYASTDHGRTWDVAYTFAVGSIRHVHNVIYDRWGDCLWILSGDDGAECKVLRASCDLRSVDVVLSGSQQTRAVAAIPTKQGLYFSTDTPLEKNYVYRLDRAGNLEQVGALASSSIYGCQVGAAMFFSTMVEPSAVNRCRQVQIAGSRTGTQWQAIAGWYKDGLPMRYFQYGNAVLPDGENNTCYLAATSVAVKTDDLVTTLWEVESA